MAAIYIVFSSTPNRVGRLVRKFTREEFNHASIALDQNLTQMYGFARRFYRTPLYGGFVKESLSRYHQNGQASHICVCKIPVTAEQYKELEQLLTKMENDSDHYLYNHLSALGAVMHRRVYVKDAYTCIEFCVDILHKLGVDIDPKQHYTICQVAQMLLPYSIYEGSMPEGNYDAEFYAKRPVPHPLFTTLRDMLKLLPRLGI